jgi:hypothetical protein
MPPVESLVCLIHRCSAEIVDNWRATQTSPEEIVAVVATNGSFREALDNSAPFLRVARVAVVICGNATAMKFLHSGPISHQYLSRGNVLIDDRVPAKSAEGRPVPFRPSIAATRIKVYDCPFAQETIRHTFVPPGSFAGGGFLVRPCVALSPATFVDFSHIKTLIINVKYRLIAVSNEKNMGRLLRFEAIPINPMDFLLQLRPIESGNDQVFDMESVKRSTV